MIIALIYFYRLGLPQAEAAATRCWDRRRRCHRSADPAFRLSNADLQIWFYIPNTPGDLYSQIAYGSQPRACPSCLCGVVPYAQIQPKDSRTLLVCE